MAVRCRITRVDLLLYCMCSGVDTTLPRWQPEPFLWDILQGKDVSCSWYPPFYLSSSTPQGSILDWRYIGWTRVISKSSARLKMSQFFTHLTKTLPKPETLQPAQFLHQYLNIQARMSHFLEVANNTKFRPSKLPNILHLNTPRILKSGSSYNCLGRKKMFECF